MDSLYERFCVRYLKNGMKPIKFTYLCSLLRIYLISNGVNKLDNLKFKDTLDSMKYANTNEKYYYVDFRPFKNQSKTYKYIKNCIENMGYILLYEVECPHDKNSEYDFAFIYNGWCGSYLYYIIIDDNLEYQENIKFKKDYAANNAYLILLNSDFLYNTRDTINHAINKWFLSSPVTFIKSK
jgi:hypothetical protein